VLHVARLKGGLSTTQPLALPASPFVLRSVNFEDPWAAVASTRRGPLTRSRSSQGPLRFEKSKRADNLPSQSWRRGYGTSVTGKAIFQDHIRRFAGSALADLPCAPSCQRMKARTLGTTFSFCVFTFAEQPQAQQRPTRDESKNPGTLRV